MESLSYIEISKRNLLHNFKSVRSYISSGTKIVSVVKANAYGHGLDEIVKILNSYTDYFQVDDLLELKALRKISQTPTLVLGYVLNRELEEAVRLRGILGIYNIKSLKILENIGKRTKIKPKIHVKVDAYLGRQGILLNQIDKFIGHLKTFKHIEIQGVYSHFSNIEDTTNFTHAEKQIAAYKKAVEKFKKAGFGNLLTHISATSGILRYEQGKRLNNLVRLGIGLYGMWPSRDLRKKFQRKITLKPAMRWVTHVAQVKILPANYPIGYGLTYITKRPTKVAIIPQGYGDGYDRGLSNIGEVLIQGRRCRILGRVAMNMFVVDVSHIKQARQEDEVILLGWQKDQSITAEEIAEKIDTMNYEITTRVSPLLPHIII